MTANDLVMTPAKLCEVETLVRDFHYSRCLPKAPRFSFALREPGGLFGDGGEPVAAAIYGYPVNRMWPQDALELQRLVRRDDCTAKLSELVAYSLRWLKANTGAPFVLSYADTAAGHHGGIYQASGFLFVGSTKGQRGQYYRTAEGEMIHGRAVNRRYGTARHGEIARLQPTWEPVAPEPKHLYVRPLRQRLKPLLRRFGWQTLPFPKPDAACPLDAPVPAGASGARPPEAAPFSCDSGSDRNGENSRSEVECEASQSGIAQRLVA